ncbi:MAG: hypothetical protein LBL44_07395 [Treponema sp.]|jgi:ribosomal protein L37AE/L43A|nr:hypothetical protein [Treponema sp.]
MSKAHRGKGIRELAAHGRGACPVCGRQNVKILYEQESGEEKIKICKVCRAAVKHGKKSIAAVAAPAAKSAVREAEAAAPAGTGSAG